MLFYNIVGKEREEKEREGDCQKHYTISKRCTAHRALIAGREGCGSENREEKGPVSCLKRGA